MNPHLNRSASRDTLKSGAALVAVLVAGLSITRAASLYWDAVPGTADGTSQGGAGTWDTATANWDDGATYQTWDNTANAGDTAVFAGSAGAVAIDAGGVTAGALDVTGGYTFSGGAITAAGGLVKSGSGTLTITNNNSITGDIVINSGDVQLGTNNNTGSLNGGSYAGNILIASGSTFRDRSNNSVTMSGVISGEGNLHQDGGGTMTLTGDNTYTGRTIIAASGAGGPSLSVSSLNSVNGGTPLMASSSLGAPTTEANGKIQLGSGTNVRSCSLIYTGAGETTDRVMDVRFNSSAKQSIDTSGTGLLQFTSDFTITPSSGNTSGGLYLKGNGDGQIPRIGTIPGFFEKQGTGTWTVAGTNSVDKATVNAGTLVLNGNFTSRTGTFNVNGTSTLAGTATITDPTPGAVNVVVAAGAQVTPGTSVGTLAVDGTLNISALAGGSGLLNFELDIVAASDKIVAGTLEIGTDVLDFSDFTFTALGGLENGTYTLISTGAAVIGTLDPTPANLTGTIGTGPATGTLRISGSGTDIELVVSGAAGGSAYDAWASTNAPSGGPDDDFDGDGVSNAVEFVLGGDKNTNDLDKLPAPSISGGDILFNFERDRASIDPATTVTIEVSTDLMAWDTPPSPYPVPDADTGGVVNPGVTVVSGDGTDTVTLRVAQEAAAKKFARLKVVIAP